MPPSFSGNSLLASPKRQGETSEIYLNTSTNKDLSECDEASYWGLYSINECCLNYFDHRRLTGLACGNFSGIAHTFQSFWHAPTDLRQGLSHYALQRA